MRDEVLIIIITHHLQVRDADIKDFVHVGVPHHTNIGDVQCPKVTLQCGQQENILTSIQRGP